MSRAKHKPKECRQHCYYCDMPLSKRHEHDHFPTPYELGGTDVVCACINCHDMKDRIPLGEWPIDSVMMNAEPGPVRLYLAKVGTAILRMQAEGDGDA